MDTQLLPLIDTFPTLRTNETTAFLCVYALMQPYVFTRCGRAVSLDQFFMRCCYHRAGVPSKTFFYRGWTVLKTLVSAWSGGQTIRAPASLLKKAIYTIVHLYWQDRKAQVEKSCKENQGRD